MDETKGENNNREIKTAKTAIRAGSRQMRKVRKSTQQSA